MAKKFFVYMMSSRKGGVLYTGITNDLIRRVYEHKEKLMPSFTNKYNLTKLMDS
jgi:putative endonuclease